MQAAAALEQLAQRMWDQERSTVNLIASDNAYPAQCAAEPYYPGHIIQEGLPGSRPFAGAAVHDEVETLVMGIACDVFGAEYANLQPHSCSQANQAVYQGLLQPGDKVCALDFRAGGHLTHGLKLNFSGRLYDFHFYGVGAGGWIDYDAARSLVREVRPKLVVCGSSSYPRLFDGEVLRSIADEVDAALHFDLSHEAGLIAGGAIPNEIGVADAVTMSLDKTLRGPFGGLLLCRAGMAERMDKAVHPGTQSSFSVRKVVDAGRALLLSQMQEFSEYAHGTVRHARLLGEQLAAEAIPVVSGGTDKHYLVVEVRESCGLSGPEAEHRLEGVGILASRQTVPWDRSARTMASSGVRLGTAWITSRGYSTADVEELGDVIVAVLKGSDEERGKLRDRVARLACEDRPGDVWRRYGRYRDAGH